MLAQLLALGLLAAITIFLFFPLNSGKGRVLKSPLEKHIPFIPAFVVPYVALYPYVAFSMLVVLFFTPVAARLYTSLIFSGLIAALIWYLMPTVLDRPVLSSRDIFTRMVGWIHRRDPGSNSNPSSHAYMAILCSYYLTYAFPLHETAIWVAGATIVSSTLFVKQHHVGDLLAGIALAAVSIGFSYLILGGLV